MILVVLRYYWPRFLLGLWFALAMTGLTQMRPNKKNPLISFLLMFFLSPTSVSIFVEILTSFVDTSIITQFFSGASFDVQTGIRVIFLIVSDVVSVIIPILTLAWLMSEHWTVAAGIYLIYAVIDRLGLVISLSAISYLVIAVLLLAGSYFLARNEMDYVVSHTEAIEWRPVLHYLVGLFFLVDSLYLANYVFPRGIKGDDISIFSQIVSVADVYDALTSVRAYK